MLLDFIIVSLLLIIINTFLFLIIIYFFNLALSSTQQFSNQLLTLGQLLLQHRILFQDVFFLFLHIFHQFSHGLQQFSHLPQLLIQQLRPFLRLFNLLFLCFNFQSNVFKFLLIGQCLYVASTLFQCIQESFIFY